MTDSDPDDFADYDEGKKGGAPITKCIGCLSRCSNKAARCIRPDPERGCQNCLRYGLVCIRRGVVLPAAERNPPEERRLRRAGFTPCDPCQQNGRDCDLKRPCDSCVLAGAQCTGSKRSCFWRGVPSDDFYGYYLNLGHGVGGIGDPYPGGNREWVMPDDYHVEFTEWANARGEHIRRRREPRVYSERGNAGRNPQDRVSYQEIESIATEAVSRGVPVDLAGIRPLLALDLANSVPFGDSQAVRDLRWYFVRQDALRRRFDEASNPRWSEVGIDISQAVGEVPDQALRSLNPGSDSDYRYIGPLRHISNVPIERPPSPGPMRPLYWIPWNARDDDVDVPIRLSRLPTSHPDYVDRTRLGRFPFPEHPNENGQSQLATIPYWRIWDNGDRFQDAVPCEAETPRGFCGRPTTSACEDTSHYRSIPICDQCEDISVRNFREVFRRLEVEIRQYICYECANSESILGQFVKTGYRVWYDVPQPLPDELDVTTQNADPSIPVNVPGNQQPDEPKKPDIPDFSAPSLVQAGLAGTVGGWMGNALEITGCACATKLLGRRICAPHRLQYLLNMQTAAARMRDYCKAIHGRMVCPLCRTRPGIDSFGFRDIMGGVNAEFHGWGCLSCHGYVLHRDRVVPWNILGTVRDVVAPPPYTVRNEEREARWLIGANIDPAIVQQEEESLWNRVLSLRDAMNQPGQPGDDDSDEL
ncbi:hypothetical protein GGR52DRAFT_567969 [Hypoxylon sp. FL1284]|nr:hypothetical protein GGR52DRAFT_567969 [Hypoxylon sp. FL1284]